ncbi:glycoside hydrolase family 19 protein [Chryseobacterium turcicum]|uniref:Glycoside hydrolase family 19 catalytic domain-containing protein n=1 Tax=Chryseobacterium turcicum TaxID=2898076 RepID=A0A9Q3YUI7_9FLAO|nr:hypothetical protein [Chryseobacterium turcicum]MCD1115994.1 hypothetical protein [Chryseobacterium turcicum]
MDRLNHEEETASSITEQNSQKMEKVREERAEKDKNDENLLLSIDGAKIKFNAHLGEFKVLNDVPTTQGKLTGTVVEKQIPNFTFYDGFQMLSLTEWQDFGNAKVQDNYVLLKKSFLPGIGKLPGNIPPETGKIEFVDSGQINMPESIDTRGAPVSEQKNEEKCFCNRDLEVEDLTKIGISQKNADKYKDALNSTFTNYNLNTCIRKLHFLAQVRHESGEFIYEEEIWGPTKTQLGYEGRKDLCHKMEGDGKRFLGRGLIQITGRCNYTSYTEYKKSKGIDIDFTKEPDNKKMGEIPYSVDSGGWYWSEKLDVNLSDYADKDDIIYITYRINGGFNGYVEDRKPKLIKMIKNSVECENSKYINYDKYSIKDSKCWKSLDAIYKYAQLSTDESKISYQQYLDLTDDYLEWPSIKGWEKNRQKKKKKTKIETRRAKAKQKIK